MYKIKLILSTPYKTTKQANMTYKTAKRSSRAAISMKRVRFDRDTQELTIRDGIQEYMEDEKFGRRIDWVWFPDLIWRDPAFEFNDPQRDMYDGRDTAQQQTKKEETLESWFTIDPKQQPEPEPEPQQQQEQMPLLDYDRLSSEAEEEWTEPEHDSGDEWPDKEWPDTDEEEEMSVPEPVPEPEQQAMKRVCFSLEKNTEHKYYYYPEDIQDTADYWTRIEDDDDSDDDDYEPLPEWKLLDNGAWLRIT